MSWSESRPEVGERGLVKAWVNLRRAFAEFLLVPTGIIVVFVALAFGFYWLDHIEFERLSPYRAFLQSHIFADAKATSDLLSTIAGSVITMTSLTITLLLIVVQQSAGSMTAQVFDQFLRRRDNQIYFGFFVGLALYALMILSTVDDPFNPVYGAALALFLTVIALCLLVVLVYTTINQMRPAVIIEAIHDHILDARQHHLPIVRQTRRASSYSGAVRIPVRARRHGFVTNLDLAPLKAAIEGASGQVEVVLDISIGSYVAFEDTLATIHASTDEDAATVGEVVRRAVRLEPQRDMKNDPAYGINQLQMIAWTSTSTAKSNPAPGMLAVQNLRDVMARWASAAAREKEAPGETLPVVYADDVFEQLMDTLENLAVVSSESMQHQIFIEIVETFTVLFDRLRPEEQEHVEQIILRMLSVLGDHVLTAKLDTSLSKLANVLRASSRHATADALHAAQEQLRASIGHLNSRSTRVPMG